MSVLLTEVEHAYAVAASDVVKAYKFVEEKVVPVLKSVEADQSTIEAVTGLVSPQAANIERVAFAVLGYAVQALEGADAAVEGKGLNVSLDAAFVADLKAIVPAVKAAVAKLAK